MNKEYAQVERKYFGNDPIVLETNVSITRNSAGDIVLHTHTEIDQSVPPPCNIESIGAAICALMSCARDIIEGAPETQQPELQQILMDTIAEHTTPS